MKLLQFIFCILGFSYTYILSTPLAASSTSEDNVCQLVQHKKGEEPRVRTYEQTEDDRQNVIKALKTLPDTPLSFDIKEHFVTYIVNIAPYLDSDYFAAQMGFAPISEQASPDRFNSLFHLVGSPTSYLRSLTRIGHEFRAHVINHSGVDLSDLKVKRVIEEEHISESMPFTRSFPQMQPQKLHHLEIFRLGGELIKTIHQLYLKKAGFKLPVVFTGFIPPKKANAYVRDSLFIDDVLTTGNFSHGKFSHLLMASMLLEYFPEIDHNWFGDLADTGGWDKLLDNGGSAEKDADVMIALYCKVDGVKVVERQWQLKSWPYLHNPIVFNQMMAKGYFSDILLRASETPQASHLFAFDSQESLYQAFLDVKALENFINLEFENDFQILYSKRSMVRPTTFTNQLEKRCSLNDLTDEGIGRYASTFSEDYAGDQNMQLCKALSYFYQAYFSTHNFDEFYALMIRQMLRIQTDLTNFYTPAMSMFLTLKDYWITENKLPLLDNKRGNFHIYRIP